MKAIIKQLITLSVFLIVGSGAMAPKLLQRCTEGNQATYAGDCTE